MKTREVFNLENGKESDFSDFKNINPKLPPKQRIEIFLKENEKPTETMLGEITVKNYFSEQDTLQNRLEKIILG
jgi:hypothetical protein